MKITREHMEAVSKLNADERYSYVIKRIADWEEMYTLVDDQGEIVTSEIDGKVMVPFWSAAEFASSCATGGWADAETKKITLDDFEDEILDFLDENDYLMNIFPVGDKTGFVVDLLEFSKDLSNELKNYQ